MKPVRISVLILFACFVSLAWGQQPGKRWSQFHRHNMERWNPYDKVLSVQNVGGLGLKWSYATGSDVDSSPAIANGVVYVGSWDDKVYALGAGTGALLWSYTTGNVVTSSPAVANGVVYVGSDDDNVYALNARTGTLLWSYATGSLVESSPRRGEWGGLCRLGRRPHVRLRPEEEKGGLRQARRIEDDGERGGHTGAGTHLRSKNG